VLSELILGSIQAANAQDCQLTFAGTNRGLEQDVVAEWRVPTKQVGVLDQRSEHVVNLASVGQRAKGAKRFDRHVVASNR
jgi:hypothetical protein